MFAATSAPQAQNATTKSMAHRQQIGIRSANGSTRMGLRHRHQRATVLVRRRQTGSPIETKWTKGKLRKERRLRKEKCPNHHRLPGTHSRPHLSHNHLLTFSSIPPSLRKVHTISLLATHSHNAQLTYHAFHQSRFSHNIFPSSRFCC